MGEDRGGDPAVLEDSESLQGVGPHGLILQRGAQEGDRLGVLAGAQARDGQDAAFARRTRIAEGGSERRERRRVPEHGGEDQ